LAPGSSEWTCGIEKWKGVKWYRGNAELADAIHQACAT
jgi:hypothetical protein